MFLPRIVVGGRNLSELPAPSPLEPLLGTMLDGDLGPTVTAGSPVHGDWQGFFYTTAFCSFPPPEFSR